MDSRAVCIPPSHKPPNPQRFDPFKYACVLRKSKRADAPSLADATTSCGSGSGSGSGVSGCAPDFSKLTGRTDSAGCENVPPLGNSWEAGVCKRVAERQEGTFWDSRGVQYSNVSWNEGTNETFLVCAGEDESDDAKSRQDDGSDQEKPNDDGKWDDGTRCLLGTTCKNCRNPNTFWKSLFTWACGTEPTVSESPSEYEQRDAICKPLLREACGAPDCTWSTLMGRCRARSDVQMDEHDCASHASRDACASPCAWNETMNVCYNERTSYCRDEKTHDACSGRAECFWNEVSNSCWSTRRLVIISIVSVCVFVLLLLAYFVTKVGSSQSNKSSLMQSLMEKLSEQRFGKFPGSLRSKSVSIG